MDEIIGRPASPIHQRLAGISGWLALMLAFGSGAIASLGFQPVGSAAGPIAGSALFLMLLAARGVKQAFPLGLLFGMGQFLPSLDWIATAFTFQSAMPAWMGAVAVAGLSLFLSLYPAIAAFAARKLTAQIVPLTLLFAAIFIATEILRGLLFSGFSWNPLGAGWLQLGGVAQLAAFFGANGLSGLAILAGGSIAALLCGRNEAGRGALIMVFPILLLMGGLIPRIQKPLPEPTGPQLLLVQPGTGINDKHGAENGLERAMIDAIRLTRAALAKGPAPAAVIWPEATVEFPLEEDPELREILVRDMPAGTLLLTGGVAIERDTSGEIRGARNSLYALSPDGEILARYDKAHLVPGGEYLPLRAIAEPLGLSRLVPGSLDFLPGPGPVTWNLPGLPAISPNICYEIIFPGAITDRDNRPEMILTVSNDAWFGASGPPQHHAQARLRAIEEGLPVIRVTPTGISGVIDPRGGLVNILPQHRPAFARISIPAPMAATPFSMLGLTAPGLFALILLALGLLAKRSNGNRKT